MSDLASTSSVDKGKEGEVSSSCDSSTPSAEPVASIDPEESRFTEIPQRDEDRACERVDTSDVLLESLVSGTAGNANCDVRENPGFHSACESLPNVSTEVCEPNISTTCELKPSTENSELTLSTLDSNVAVSCFREQSSLDRNLRDNDVISTASADSTSVTSVGSTKCETNTFQEKQISSSGDDSTPVSTSFALSRNHCSPTEQESVSNSSDPTPMCEVAAAPNSLMDVAHSSGISVTCITGKTKSKTNESCDMPSSSTRNVMEQSNSDSFAVVKSSGNSFDPVSSSRDVDNSVLHSLPSVSSNKHVDDNIDTSIPASLDSITVPSNTGVGVVEKDASSTINAAKVSTCSSAPICESSALPKDVASSSTTPSEMIDGTKLESVSLATEGVDEQPSDLCSSKVSPRCEVSTSVDKCEDPKTTEHSTGCKGSQNSSSPISAQSSDNNAADCLQNVEDKSSELPDVSDVSESKALHENNPSPSSYPSAASKSSGLSGSSGSKADVDVETQIAVKTDCFQSVVAVSLEDSSLPYIKQNIELNAGELKADEKTPGDGDVLCSSGSSSVTRQEDESDKNTGAVDVIEKCLAGTSVEQELVSDGSAPSVETVVQDAVLLEARNSDHALSRNPESVKISDEVEKLDVGSCGRVSQPSKVISHSGEKNVASISVEPVKSSGKVCNVPPFLSGRSSFTCEASSAMEGGGLAKSENGVFEGKLLQGSAFLEKKHEGKDVLDNVGLKERKNIADEPIGNVKTPQEIMTTSGQHVAKDTAGLLNAAGGVSCRSSTYLKLIKPLTVNLTDISKLEKICVGSGATILFKDLLNPSDAVAESSAGDLKVSNLPIPKIVLSRLKSEVTGTVKTVSESKAQETPPPKLEGSKSVIICQTEGQQKKCDLSLAEKEQVTKKMGGQSISESLASERILPSKKKDVKDVEETSKQEILSKQCVSILTKSDCVGTKDLQKKKEEVGGTGIVDTASCLESIKEKSVPLLESTGNSLVSEDVKKSKLMVVGKSQISKEFEKSVQFVPIDSEICKDVGKSVSAVAVDILPCHELGKEKLLQNLKPIEVSKIDKNVSESMSNATADLQICKDVGESVPVLTGDSQICKDDDGSVPVATVNSQSLDAVDKCESVVLGESPIEDDVGNSTFVVTADSQINKDIDSSTSVASVDRSCDESSEEKQITALKSTGDTQICKDVKSQDSDKTAAVGTIDVIFHHELSKEDPVVDLDITSDSQISQDAKKCVSSVTGVPSVCKDFEKSLVTSGISAYHDSVKEKSVTDMEPVNESPICKDVKSTSVISNDSQICDDVIQPTVVVTDESQSCKDIESAPSTADKILPYHESEKEKLVMALDPVGDFQICKDIDKSASVVIDSQTSHSVGSSAEDVTNNISCSEADEKKPATASNTLIDLQISEDINKLTSVVTDHSEICSNADKSTTVATGNILSHLEPDKRKTERTLKPVADSQIPKIIDGPTSVMTGDISSHESDKEKTLTVLEPVSDSQISKGASKIKSLSITDVSYICESGNEKRTSALDHANDSQTSQIVNKRTPVVETVNSSCKEEPSTELEADDSVQLCKDAGKPTSSMTGDITSCHELDKEKPVTISEPSGDLQVYKDIEKPVPVVARDSQVFNDVKNSTEVVIGDNVPCHESCNEQSVTMLKHTDETQVCKDTDKHLSTLTSLSETVKGVKETVVSEHKSESAVCAPFAGKVTLGSEALLKTACLQSIEESKSTSASEHFDGNRGEKENLPVVLKSTDSGESNSSKEGKLVEKITLKLKKDGTDSFIATHKKIKIPSESASDKISVVEKETLNPEKITLKLKKDYSKTAAFIVSSNDKPTDVQPDSSGSSEKCPERITLKLKKQLGKSEQFVLSSASEEASKQTGDKADLHSICEEPALEKIKLKRLKDGSNSDVYITSSKISPGINTTDKAENVSAQKVPHCTDKVANTSKEVEDVVSLSDGHSNVTSEEVKDEKAAKMSSGQSFALHPVTDSMKYVLESPLESSSPNAEHEQSLLSEVKFKGNKSRVDKKRKIVSKSPTIGELNVSHELKLDVVPASEDVEKLSSKVHEQVMVSETAELSGERLTTLDAKRVDGSGKEGNKDDHKQLEKKLELGTKIAKITKIQEDAVESQAECSKGDVRLKRKIGESISSPVTVAKKIKDTDEVVAAESTCVLSADVNVNVASNSHHERKKFVQSDHSTLDVLGHGSLTGKVEKGEDLQASSSSCIVALEKIVSEVPIIDLSLVAAENTATENVVAVGRKMTGKDIQQIPAEKKAGARAVETEEITTLTCEIVEEVSKSHDVHPGNHSVRKDAKIEPKLPAHVIEPKTLGRSVTISKCGSSDTVAKSASENVDHNVLKIDESSHGDESKPGKITLTLKKSAAWSVKQPDSQAVEIVDDNSDGASVEEVDELVLLEEHPKRTIQEAQPVCSKKREIGHNLATIEYGTKKQKLEERHLLGSQLPMGSGCSMRLKKIPEKRLFDSMRLRECDVKRLKVDVEKSNVSAVRTASTSKILPQEPQPHKKETVPKPSVEDKLRQILSRMGTKVSSVFNNEVSITLTAPKSSTKAGPAGNLKFSDSCEIEVTPEVNIVASEVDVIAEGDDSNSQDVVILEEKIVPRTQPSIPSIGHTDGVFLKKNRGRPRKPGIGRQTPAIPVPPQAVLLNVSSRPKRTCRGREQKPLSQPKAKKPRIAGAGRGRKKSFGVGSEFASGSMSQEVKRETGLKPSTMAALLKTVSIVKVKPPHAMQAFVSTHSHSSSVAQLSSDASAATHPAQVLVTAPTRKPNSRTFSRANTSKAGTGPARSATTSVTKSTSLKSRGVSSTATTTIGPTITTVAVATTASLNTITSITTGAGRKVTSTVMTATPVITASMAAVTDANVIGSSKDVATAEGTATASPSICTGVLTTSVSTDTTTSVFTTITTSVLTTITSTVAVVTTAAPITTTTVSTLAPEAPSAVGITTTVSAAAGVLPAPAGSPCPAPLTSSVQVFEEETRMSAESNSRSQTPARSLPTAVTGEVVGEESQGSVVSTATTESVKNRKNRMEIPLDTENIKEFTVDMLAEYLWPPDKHGEHLMVQEQISQYLGVKSFKRKYPDIRRRPVEAEEKTYLREKGLVSEYMSDLGLTAVVSSEILDIMYTDFQDKYEEYRRYMRDRQAKEFTSKQKAISAVTSGEKSKQDYKEKAVSSAASWNSSFNRSRKEERRCSFDLQSFTIHYPRNRHENMTLKDLPKVGNYPIALIPGQYTDYYKRYTPTEIRYFPLNTILYGPMKPNERHEVKGSDGSQSDSDGDSSSDSSSSSSSEDTQDTDESESTAGDKEHTDSPGQAPVKTAGEGEKEASESATCKVCQGGRGRNKDGRPEILINCGQCGSSSHPTCLDLTLDMVPQIRRYSWQCTDCKTCIQCKDPADEDKMLFCDMCDRGYHIYCVGLRRVPNGRWHCKECAVCGSCGAQEPGGTNMDVPNAQWQHEYKKGEKGTRVYAQTLCVPCSKLWRKGRYCQLCWRCYINKPDEEVGLINCSVCEKWMHAECCSVIGGKEVDRSTSFLCELCQEKGQARSTTIKVVPRSVIRV